MDLIKQLTGKNPAEYESAAKLLVDNSDVNLFEKLVKQEDFLFDFVKNNVAKRIKNACNKDNYLNLMNFLDYYSPSYDTVIAEVLYEFGGTELLPEMKDTDHRRILRYCIIPLWHAPHSYFFHTLCSSSLASLSLFVILPGFPAIP